MGYKNLLTLRLNFIGHYKALLHYGFLQGALMSNKSEKNHRDRGDDGVQYCHLHNNKIFTPLTAGRGQIFQEPPAVKGVKVLLLCK